MNKHPEAAGLSDEQITDWALDFVGLEPLSDFNYVEFARAIEVQVARRLTEDHERVRGALKAVVAHWNEFGPKCGFEETVDRFARAALSADPAPPAQEPRGECIRVAGYSCGRCGCVDLVKDDTSSPELAAARKDGSTE